MSALLLCWRCFPSNCLRPTDWLPKRPLALIKIWNFHNLSYHASLLHLISHNMVPFLVPEIKNIYQYFPSKNRSLSMPVVLLYSSLCLTMISLSSQVYWLSFLGLRAFFALSNSRKSRGGLLLVVAMARDEKGWKPIRTECPVILVLLIFFIVSVPSIPCRTWCQGDAKVIPTPHVMPHAHVFCWADMLNLMFYCNNKFPCILLTCSITTIYWLNHGYLKLVIVTGNPRVSPAQPVPQLWGMGFGGLGSGLGLGYRVLTGFAVWWVHRFIFYYIFYYNYITLS